MQETSVVLLYALELLDQLMYGLCLGEMRKAVTGKNGMIRKHKSN